eukprot:381673-Pyramimonas_sp.AAC.1
MNAVGASCPHLHLMRLAQFADAPQDGHPHVGLRGPGSTGPAMSAIGEILSTSPTQHSCSPSQQNGVLLQELTATMARCGGAVL